MATIGRYNPQEVTVTVNNRIITGFAEGMFVEARRTREEDFTVKVGAQGESTLIKNTDRSGMVLLTLQPHSPDNSFLGSLLAAESSFPVSVVHRDDDIKEELHGIDCVISVQPRHSYSADQENRQWTILTGELHEVKKTS